MSRNRFNYVLENIRGVLQTEIVTKLQIGPEMRLATCIYKLTRADYHYFIGEMTGIAQSTVCCINRKNVLFFKITFSKH